MSKSVNDPRLAELTGNAARALDAMLALSDSADAAQAIRQTKRGLRALADYIEQIKLAKVLVDPNDRLISLTEIAKMLHRSTRTVRQQYRDARFPFVFRDGARLVGSEAGLLRWFDQGEAW
jgi:thioredoxin-like negative regulator of GroEL